MQRYVPLFLNIHELGGLTHDSNKVLYTAIKYQTNKCLYLSKTFELEYYRQFIIITIIIEYNNNKNSYNNNNNRKRRDE